MGIIIHFLQFDKLSIMINVLVRWKWRSKEFSFTPIVTVCHLSSTWLQQLGAWIQSKIPTIFNFAEGYEILPCFFVVVFFSRSPSNPRSPYVHCVFFCLCNSSFSRGKRADLQLFSASWWPASCLCATWVPKWLRGEDVQDVGWALCIWVYLLEAWARFHWNIKDLRQTHRPPRVWDQRLASCL